MSNRQPALAQFNKLNGAFIMVLGMPDDISMLNHDFYKYVEIEIDFPEETVVGNYDNFSIVSVHDVPALLIEDDVNEVARQKILNSYPVEKQLTIISKAVEIISEALSIDVPEIVEMNAFIDEIKRSNSIRKEFYSNSPDFDYKTSEEFDEMTQRIYEGGILGYE